MASGLVRREMDVLGMVPNKNTIASPDLMQRKNASVNQVFFGIAEIVWFFKATNFYWILPTRPIIFIDDEFQFFAFAQLYAIQDVFMLPGADYDFVAPRRGDKTVGLTVLGIVIIQQFSVGVNQVNRLQFAPFDYIRGELGNALVKRVALHGRVASFAEQSGGVAVLVIQGILQMEGLY